MRDDIVVGVEKGSLVRVFALVFSLLFKTKNTKV
jgi:hypothetical protein